MHYTIKVYKWKRFCKNKLMKKRFKIYIGILTLLTGGFLILLLYPVPENLEQLNLNKSQKITDRHGTILYEVIHPQSGKQSPVQFEKIPKSLINAFIATEDQRFYEHSGIDLKAILRAIWQNAQAGKVVSGGSTITQQAVRNFIGINQKRTLTQKAKESILAIKISLLHSKEKILESYLNTIYFGNLTYGVEAASKQYFNKSAHRLGLAESSFLAGIPQAPNRYNPFKNFEGVKKRQLHVLNAMLKEGYIDESQYEAAKSTPIKLIRNQTLKKAPHFVDFILEKTSEKSEIISTTLDLGLQEKIEELIYSDLTFLKHLNINNAATILIHNPSGEIRAMVGSIDYFNKEIDGEVNVATSLRQPGSSIKPLVYALSFEKSWNPNTIIIDEPIQFKTANGQPYTPRNFDLKYRGEVTLSEALAQSLNIPAVKALDHIGIRYFLNKIKSFGINTLNSEPEHYGLSLALGSGEVKLIELTHAYSIFANNGTLKKLKWIKNTEDQSTQVLNPQSAEWIKQILSDNFLRSPAFGEENQLNLDFKIAAKTGTTRNFKDNWTLGFTDEYTLGIWVGNNDGSPLQGVSGISGAGSLFNRIMNMLHQETGTQLTLQKKFEIQPIKQKSVMETMESFRIITPFPDDHFLYNPQKPNDQQKIKLEASNKAKWFINNIFYQEGKSVLWELKKGKHHIRAESLEGEKEEVWVKVE